MQFGPGGATVLSSRIKPGTNGDATIDNDNICYNTDHAFVFISNNCSQVRAEPSDCESLRLLEDHEPTAIAVCSCHAVCLRCARFLTPLDAHMGVHTCIRGSGSMVMGTFCNMQTWKLFKSAEH